MVPFLRGIVMKLIDYIFAVQESLNNEIMSPELKNLHFEKLKDQLYLISDSTNIGTRHSEVIDKFWFELRYFDQEGNVQLYTFTVTDESINFKNNQTHEEYHNLEKDEYFNLCFSIDNKLLDYKDLEKIKENAIKFKNIIIFYSLGEETYHD